MAERRGTRGQHPPTPDAALRALMEGNKRHQRGELDRRDYSPVGENRSGSQMPFAAIISCADSRVSPILIFDLEPGNLFVSRVAGNSIDTGTLGSTEYAVKVLGVKLVMVLGHSDCGAVQAAIDVVTGAASHPPDEFGEIGSVVDRVTPAIEGLPPDERTAERCVAGNAKAQAEDIASRAPIIQPAIASGRIEVVSAVYDIATGRVRLV